jgi:hypothetical protein
MTTLTATVWHDNPSAVNRLPKDFDMVLDKAHRPPRNEAPDAPERFADRVREIFPKGATARLARSVEINQRMAQRWMSGQNEAPPDVLEFVAEQTKALQGADIAGQMQRMIEGLQAKGLHGEVIAAQIADAYEQLIGRDIE